MDILIRYTTFWTSKGAIRRGCFSFFVYNSKRLFWPENETKDLIVMQMLIFTYKAMCEEKMIFWVVPNNLGNIKDNLCQQTIINKNKTMKHNDTGRVFFFQYNLKNLCIIKVRFYLFTICLIFIKLFIYLPANL